MPSPVFEIFEVELQNTLNNLYEPTYLPEACIFDILSISPEEGMESVRRNLVESIKAMGQEEIIPKTTKIHFLFLVLQQRFVISQSQEKAAEILQISPRHFRRKQNEAVHALALQLWNKRHSGLTGAAVREPEISNSAAVDTHQQRDTAWDETILPEIAILNQRSLGITTDLQKVIQRTLEMTRHLLATSKVQVEVLDIEHGLEIPIHPNVLRQVILLVIQQIIQSNDEGLVQISAHGRFDTSVIRFATDAFEPAERFQIDQIEKLASMLGGEVQTIQSDERCDLELIFPNSASVTVLVIDDNSEVERLYRQFTANTRYKIYYQSSGIDLAAQIRKVTPDILIIDVLLPGLDGWDLLMQLRQDPATANLPVIVSSVMGSPEIARSLGANAYLPKPVERKSLLQALEENV
jgi:CheY-like chemotaxis protein